VQSEKISAEIKLNTYSQQFDQELLAFASFYEINVKIIRAYLSEINFERIPQWARTPGCKDIQVGKLSGNIDLGIITNQLESNKLTTEYHNTGGEPSLDLRASMSTNGTSTDAAEGYNGFGEGDPKYEIGFYLSFPIGPDTSTVENHRVRLDTIEKQTNLFATKRVKLSDYKTLCVEQNIRKKNVSLYKKNLKILKQRFKLSLSDFDRGNITTSDLVRASRDQNFQEISHYLNLIAILGNYFQLLEIEGKIGELL
jgi:hypothetical protein